ncbi:MAG: hypothetical protein C5B46_03750 [Proteobacteria bacterium]|nr:MAG: hypothetical protein C5B46_03750 [Pseudomonadota bacterium]
MPKAAPCGAHYKIKKNAGQFAGNYPKPKKQKKPSGYYRSSLTGQVVYGKPKISRPFFRSLSLEG